MQICAELENENADLIGELKQDYRIERTGDLNLKSLKLFKNYTNNCIYIKYFTNGIDKDHTNR